VLDNMNKQYTYNTIQYGFSIAHRKWKFTNGNFSFYASVKGQELAHKIAHIMSGSLSRTKNKGLDNLARANINQILA
jgi:hypothetical protein